MNDKLKTARWSTFFEKFNFLIAVRLILYSLVIAPVSRNLMSTGRLCGKLCGRLCGYLMLKPSITQYFFTSVQCIENIAFSSAVNNVLADTHRSVILRSYKRRCSQ